LQSKYPELQDCGRKPEEMCRAGQTKEAFEVLEELNGGKRVPLDHRVTLPIQRRGICINTNQTKTHPGARQANIVQTTKQPEVGLVRAG
jgi:hypothetical protein